jgi:hypothetical protein
MPFDPVALIFYALVCGTLAAYAPSFGSRTRRAMLGAAVGMVAAFLLAAARSVVGF